MWYCSECGKKNNGKFCTRCGTKYVEIDDDPPMMSVKKTSENETEAVSNLQGERYSESAANEDDGFSSAAALFRRGCEEESEPLTDIEIRVKEVHPPVETEVSEEAETLPLEQEISNVEKASSETEIVADEILPKEKSLAEGIPEALDLPEDPVFVLRGSGLCEKESEMFSERSPFLHGDIQAEEENGGAEFLRCEYKNSDTVADLPLEELENTAEVISHRRPPETTEDKEWKYSKRALIAVGAICGVVILALIILIGSLLTQHKEETTMPASTGVYYYVSGVEDTAALYEDKSIKSDVLAELKNGTPVEYLEKVNSEFILVYDHDSEQYGYVRAAALVKDKGDIDFGEVSNEYDSEKSLGYYYVTKTENYLTLWENEDGGGTVKAKLKNGYKVSLLERTNDFFWFVFDYTSAERGYVRKSYLTDSKSKVVGVYHEPKDKTITGDYFVKGVKQYLPIWSKPDSTSSLRGRLQNGDKVGLIQKTTSSYWYVYGYERGVYGYIANSYLTTEDPNPKQEVSAYTVTGTEEYLPVLSEAAEGSEEVTQLHNGDKVTVLDSSNETFWYIEAQSTGAKGYVVKDYLTQ